MAKAEEKQPKPTCFVIMPISDPEGYEKGHFRTVYEHLILPACDKAGFDTTRADDPKQTNYIILDILKRIIEADLVVCDLSARNPNVFFELGIRQAFDLKVVLIKDDNTDRVFDIQGFRTFDYSKSLKVDVVKKQIDSLSKTIIDTTEASKSDINSLVKLLKIRKAEIGEGTEISPDTSLLLNAIKDISNRISYIEKEADIRHQLPIKRNPRLALPSGDFAERGSLLTDLEGKIIGELHGINKDGIILRDSIGTLFVIRPEDDRFFALIKM